MLKLQSSFASARAVVLTQGPAAPLQLMSTSYSAAAVANDRDIQDMQPSINLITLVGIMAQTRACAAEILLGGKLTTFCTYLCLCLPDGSLNFPG